VKADKRGRRCGIIAAWIGTKRAPWPASSAHGCSPTAAPTDPVAALAGVDELLATFRRSGLDIAEHVDGPVRPVAVATDQTAYRVIQESLTNVCKHAGPTTVDVRLAYRSDSLRITVDNRPPSTARRCAPPHTPSGTGWSACGSASPRSVEACKPVPGRTAVSGST
jgi:hypothetical protein